MLIVDKPVGMTSMDVVAVVRGRAGDARTGHAGTLDPLADGVLVLALGRATKSLDRFMATTKRYRTVIDLSAFTSTDDLEGDRLEVEVEVADEPPDETSVRSVLETFRGRIMQRPPQRSAVKIGGRRAYAMARRGETVALEPRPVDVYELELVRYAWPLLEIAVCCGKGTYVRPACRPGPTRIRAEAVWWGWSGLRGRSCGASRCCSCTASVCPCRPAASRRRG